MRIISGRAKGTRLHSLDKPTLRPMLDRVKESLFNILRDEVARARVLDLFSGSGSLGLEAVSRGAESCVFVEADPDLADLISRNAAKCRLSGRCVLIPADVFHLPRREPPGEWLPADLVFADPPYAMIDDPNRRAELFQVLEAFIPDWIAPGALLVLHHEPIPYALWPTERLVESDKRIYGRSQLTFFEVEPHDG